MVPLFFLLQANGASTSPIPWILLGGVVLWVLWRINQIEILHDSWFQSFEGRPHTTQQFYDTVVALLKERNMPALSICSVAHHTHGFLSAKREYLRVQYRNYIFTICAAPFGKNFFVSWRLGEIKSRLFAKQEQKTFYEQDTELLFSLVVKTSVEQAVALLTEQVGVRNKDAVTTAVA